MSNQFYKYLSDELNKFLNNDVVKAGDRFYLEFDEDSQVEEFYKTIKENNDTEIFCYQHEKGSKYSTYYIPVNNVKVVIISTIDVTSAYMVTIRNESRNQKDVWCNTAIIYLCKDTNDSIKSGSQNLKSEGMPFSIKKISENLDNMIDSSNLSKVDKEVMKFYKNNKLDDIYSSSLFDYEQILSDVYKGKVEKEDYKEIGLFYDKGLEKESNGNVKAIQKRLKENYDLFTKVQGYQEYEDKEQQLEKLFDDKGVNKLLKNDWQESVDFGDVKRSYENNKDDKPLQYEENLDKHINDKVVYWEKAKSDTAAGKRKREIIIFNKGIEDYIEVSFDFNDTLYKEYINDDSKKYISVSGKKMTIKLPVDKVKSSFYKLGYKHKNQNKSKYEFKIVIVNIDEKYLDSIKTIYSISNGSGAKNRIIVNSNGSEIKFGCGDFEREVEVEESDEEVSISESETIRISNFSPAWGDDSLKLKLNIQGNIIPIEIKEENLRSKPIYSVSIAKKKRELKESFIWEDNKIKQSTSEYFIEEKLKDTLLKEKDMIENYIFYGEEGIDNINKIDMHFGEKLTNAYENIINYYKENNSIPSLQYLDDELKNLYVEYVTAFNEELEEIQERDILSSNDKKINLLKLGTIKGIGRIMFTPLSPLCVAYLLELNRQLDGEVIENHIIERLIPNNLLPYIYDSNNEIYKPIYQKSNIEWIIYEKKENVSLGETNAYVAKVVREKLTQFIKNFRYLFPTGSHAPIKINVINIKNDKEVVRGVFEFIKDQIINHNNDIIPIEISVFNERGISEFDKFFEITSIDKLEEEFNISFKCKDNIFDPIDILRMCLDNIKYYKNRGNNYNYAHISFYKSSDSDKEAEDNTSSLESGLSLGGLLSTVTSNHNENDYRIGFGSKNSINNNELIRTANNINEFALNCKNNGINPYRKDTSIVSRPLILDEDTKDKLFVSSIWVTFIEPNFGLEYFNDSNKDSLVVIHYSDQYTSTDQYDTITVTNKSDQYKYIIREFLQKKKIELSDKKINEVIRSFNSINGEWLLNLIANKSEFDREKLSIISALKYGLAIFDNKDIIWVPVSLEEILRISSAVKLNKSEGIFSVKNLKEKGIHSDDLIFIGLNIKDKNKLKMYYYPVEVKVGYNFSNVITKGKEQCEVTYNLIKNQLFELYDEDRKVFKNKFFRNFFVKILISNVQKLIINNVWDNKKFDRILEVKNKLLNDEYEISYELEKYIGKGALISFKKDNHWRSIKKEDDISYIELTEDDAYYGVGKDIDEINNEIENNCLDIDKNSLLRSVNIENELSVKEIIKEVDNGSNEIKNKGLEKNKKEVKEYKKPANSSESIRLLIGQAEGSTKNIYWEYGNKELPNRHMIITGKSGNGKTYFIQCLLGELINKGVPAIIIDYTNGFKKSQLEDEFKELVGDKLKQIIVAVDKFPLNPFRKGKKELDEDLYIDEDNIDVAQRFQSIIGTVYKDLGNQQLNSIYEAVIRGLEKYNGKLNLKAFKDELEEDNSSYAQTALNQLNVFLGKNIFEENQQFEWEDIHKDGGQVLIIQLATYSPDIQRIITEMILWDLWNYKAQFGKKDKPFAVVLDEAQNLNFGDNSPCTKILTEGRKFGWSAWFSTQFLKGQMDKATISRLQNSSEKIYFAQTEEEANSLASVFGNSAEERKSWTKKLINLEKGSCFVYAPICDESGQLISTEPIKVDITSLGDRIKNKPSYNKEKGV